MGDFDSSKTRVAPFFNRLCERDWTGRKWLGPLLRLPQLPGVSRSEVELASPALRDCGWGEGEKPLPAPRSLLEWLIRNLHPPRREEDLGTGEVRAKREALLRQDPAVIRQALERLATTDRPDRAWWLFEGPSRPDAYLETDDEIIVIEGKRTEPAATTYTTWMAVRHQMLRHMDAAWDLRRGRRVYGFFMVEGEGGETGVECETPAFHLDSWTAQLGALAAATDRISSLGSMTMSSGNRAGATDHGCGAGPLSNPGGCPVPWWPRSSDDRPRDEPGSGRRVRRHSGARCGHPRACSRAANLGGFARGS
jgi:hypothetical protein